MVKASSDKSPHTPAEKSSRGYEFGSLENQRFTRLAAVMQFVALMLTVVVLLSARQVVPALWRHFQLDQLRPAAHQLGFLLLPTIIAIWTFRAGTHLRRIVHTEGDDIRHLMRAISALTRLYILQLSLLLLATAALLALWFAAGLG
jgi:hypothetical protein